MKTNRETLENELLVAFEKYGADRNLVTKLQSKLINKGISYGRTIGIINTNIPLETLDIAQLYLITNTLHQVTGDEKLKIDKFFNESEIQEMEDYKIEQEKAKDYIEFDNAEKVSDNQWVVVLPALEIAKIYNQCNVRYNQKTQRNKISKAYRDSIIQKVPINYNSVNSIEKLILEGKFISNTITFNVLLKNEKQIEYDIEDKRLIIYDVLDILDGFHRSLAILKVVQQNPDIKFNMIVNITNFTVEKAQEFIVQEDKRNKIAKRHIESISHDKLENTVVRNLNERGNNDLRGKITTDIGLYKMNKTYVLFDTIRDAIENEFVIKSMRDVNSITDYLIEGFNEIIGIFTDDFRNLDSSRKSNYKTYNNMFIGYISLLKEFYGKENWKLKLEKTLNNINFNIDNPIWSEDNLDIKNNQMSKRNAKKISKYFKNLIEKEIANNEQK